MWTSKVRQRYQVEAARADRYLPMFNQTSPAFRQKARELVAWAIQHLKREDRVVWFLKKARLADPHYHDAHPEDRDTGFGYSLNVLKNELGHLIGNAEVNQHRQVLDYSWPAKLTYRELVDKLTELERLEMKADERLVDDGDPAFMTFEDGWQWQLLDRPKCEREGKAMRHCGNAAGKPGDQILSLREPTTFKSRRMWKPHATFILNDGVLGEMKGFANEKPGPELHRYIVALLKDPRITKVRGGGYAPQRNFKVTDLSPELAQDIQQVRPELVPAPGANLEELAEEIQKHGEFWQEFYQSNEENAYAQHLLEEAELRLDDLDDEARKLVQWFKGRYGKGWKDEILGMCELEPAEMWTVDNEVASTGALGDIHEQFPDDLQAQLDELTDAEKEELEELTSHTDFPYEAGDDHLVIGMGDDRWALVLDVDQLKKRIGQMLYEIAVDGTAADKRYVRETAKELGLESWQTGEDANDNEDDEGEEE